MSAPPSRSSVMQRSEMAKTDFTFSMPLRVRWAEVDAQRVVFNANYVNYFSLALWEYMRALRFRLVDREDHIDFHTVKISVELKVPLHFDDEVEIFARASCIGRTSLTFALEIYPRDGETMHSSGEIVWVSFDRTNYRPAPVPQALVDLLRGREGEHMRVKPFVPRD
ncbi:MAG: YbgC/FadM family acyl-CoA thioesterase [Mesorhizobium sp.]|nr:acyl-CoA thioesterase [Mesorhizobium sp. M7A.T.Ca.US.000.02.1.1]RUT94719.1 acyl-CoA thioesterase [Mesorhizobium sp. M7A.T.Ca.US.000.02.2.1]RUU05802.1 acyl-CoA thioesterase [Mesorhizobium sp. M7A.T.Ca.TU.009.02.1.1]RUU64864.1 acyl-CoA thioesterase [Mesorhizobium sp. M7A.T.Ca.TU.009.01.1.1]RUU88903.1 acyl-CoA thioesterase [Mesorhizobium sp. M7A.T.Ca.TU.009.01.1.2]RUX05047.1 acyl-CoA thioesterase [Mesorhizobium sp. M8A.F.Ca.ET.023.01.1.1]RVD52157.1 acyl-CoA thioesterase [Mesorhizobium sp. M8A